ncbi:RnfH family protein [Chitinimonas naiadis]
MSDTIQVEVACAIPDKQRLVVLHLAAGSTVADALAASGLAAMFPELTLADCPVGVHGRVCAPNAVLRELDRVEVYRPLLADPKDARHRRVALGKTMKKAGDE